MKWEMFRVTRYGISLFRLLCSCWPGYTTAMSCRNTAPDARSYNSLFGAGAALLMR